MICKYFLPFYGFFSFFLMVSLKHKGLYFLDLAMLSSQPQIKSGPLVVKAWNPNLWTAREIPEVFNLFFLAALGLSCGPRDL